MFQCKNVVRANMNKHRSANRIQCEILFYSFLIQYDVNYFKIYSMNKLLFMIELDNNNNNSGTVSR